MYGSVHPYVFARLPGGAVWREAWPDERNWFKENLTVSGFATPDGFVVINPYSRLSHKQILSVLINEAVRVFLKRPRTRIRIFALTTLQNKRFGQYGVPRDQRDTIIARLVAKDPSAGRPTPEQERIARTVSKAMSIDNYLRSNSRIRLQNLAYRLR